MCRNLTFPQLGGLWPRNRQQRIFTDYLLNSLLGSDPDKTKESEADAEATLEPLPHEVQGRK